MYDPVIVSARICALKIEQDRSALRSLIPQGGPSYQTNLVRTAMPLSVAFAAGWLVASVF